MRVEVTADDIRSGTPSDCHYCPVALAVARAAGTNPGSVSVDGVYVTIEQFDRTERNYEPPALVDEFVKAFDAGESVIPFSFDLDEDQAWTAGHSTEDDYADDPYYDSADNE